MKKSLAKKISLAVSSVVYYKHDTYRYFSIFSK